MTALNFETTMVDVDRQIHDLEEGLAGEALSLKPTVDQALHLANRLMLAFAQGAGRPTEDLTEDADSLDVFRVFVKSDPSLNAIRDNVRELVYYHNCLLAEREDALPVRPVAMAVRTIRHIHLYLRTRANQDKGRQDA